MAESQFSENHGRISPHSEPRNQQNGQGVSSHNSPTITHTPGHLVPWLVSDLRPHPSYARLGVKVPASRLNALLEMGEDAFLFPLIVTSKGIVIDGYARLEVARFSGSPDSKQVNLTCTFPFYYRPLEATSGRLGSVTNEFLIRNPCPRVRLFGSEFLFFL